MENQFFIQKGSFCFIIPFFTENSSICNKYFKNLKNKIENINKNDNYGTERKRIIENAKADFINILKLIISKISDLIFILIIFLHLVLKKTIIANITDVFYANAYLLQQSSTMI